jgi:hypothetical protein
MCSVLCLKIFLTINIREGNFEVGILGIVEHPVIDSVVEYD